MAGSSIFFLGRIIRRPGSYTIVDASGLESVGLGASGFVAVIGSGEGGRPVSAITEAKDIPTFTRPEKARKTFRSGDLREAISMVFEPSADAEILAGAQKVFALKTNPATQSTAQLSNDDGAVIDLTSKDYGAFTEQINISIANGSVRGKLVTIVFEDVTETGDNIGGTDLFTLEYVDGATTWETAEATVSDTGQITITATRTDAGLSTHAVTPIVSGEVVRINATAADEGKTITIYGTAVGGARQREVITLVDGDADGTLTWGSVLGAVLSAPAEGAVQVKDESTGIDILSDFAASDIAKGAVRGDAMFVQPGTTTSIVASNTTTAAVQVWGRNAAGGIISETVSLNDTTPVNLALTTYAQIDAVVLLNVLNSRNVTLSATALRTDPTVQTTLQKCADFFDAKVMTFDGDDYGFVWTFVTGQTRQAVTNLDEVVTPVDIVTNPGGFRGDLAAVVDFINNTSQYVTAAVTDGATKTVPNNTSSPIFLSGGGEGSAQFSHWQAALNLLKKVRVNSIVVLTGDPAVHAAVIAHCDFMCGIGKSERDAFVGLSRLDNADAPLNILPTLDEAKEQIVNLNSRHVRAFAQSIDRFDTSGERTTFLPWFQACVAAGMQAGSPVGTSLTHKYGRVLSVKQDPSWNPIDDAEELIEGGLCFMETVDGVGHRFVRNITTHLSSDNLAFTEGSVNEAVNFATFNFRTNMETAVGRRGFAGTINAAKATAITTLNLLVDEGALVDYRALDLELIRDVLEVSVEIAPVIPVNFVVSTVHLVTIRQAAA
jgi:hypothetical protein